MRSASPSAQELRAKAAALFERFNEAFWDEELGFYVYALDGDKKKVLTVASNAGHCLWSDRAPRAGKEGGGAPDGARHVDGMGHRTLSADHRAFNPYNYQTGSVWPHDNAIIAMGFKFYGFGAEAARVAHDVSVAASHFCSISCRSFTLPPSAPRRTSRFSISARMCPRHGRPARSSC